MRVINPSTRLYLVLPYVYPFQDCSQRMKDESEDPHFDGAKNLKKKMTSSLLSLISFFQSSPFSSRCCSTFSSSRRKKNKLQREKRSYYFYSNNSFRLTKETTTSWYSTLLSFLPVLLNLVAFLFFPFGTRALIETIFKKKGEIKNGVK